MNNSCHDVNELCNVISHIIEDIMSYHHLDSILDKIIFEARKLTNADAGSIYLVDNNALKFGYVHNDTLFSLGFNKFLYSNHKINIDNNSIAGYVASSGKPLFIEDAYNLPDYLPCSFNRSFDKYTGYKTKSMLTIPIITGRNNFVGILQIINAMGPGKNFIAFTDNHLIFINHLAKNVGTIIERAVKNNEYCLKLIDMVQYVDPTETRSHVNRVGAYAGEIFEKLAKDQGLAGDEVRRKKDLIRSAGILHDIGKIAISDVILKKPERLTEKETSMMKYHTYAGYNFFKNHHTELDKMCADITLGHHERWDGKGYPKNIKGDNIPLSARIVALADVYDAMTSERIYRKPWKEYDVLSYIISQGGKQFDPLIVDVFGSIYGVINSIRQKYTDSVI